MKSYSDQVADTGTVTDVKSELTTLIADKELVLAQTIAATASVVAEQGKTIKYMKFRANLQSILIFLIIVTDIVRHGF